MKYFYIPFLLMLFIIPNIAYSTISLNCKTPNDCQLITNGNETLNLNIISSFNIPKNTTINQTNNIITYQQVDKISILKLIGYVSQSQKSNGAIVETPWSNYVEPAYSNYAADSVVLNNSPMIAKAWMDWYFGHINNQGVVFATYIYSNGTEKSIGTVDAVDSEIATFLTLLRDYYDKTHDYNYIKSHQTQINLMLNTLNSQQQVNGMTDGIIQRMEDNTAVWKGYYDYGYMLYENNDPNYSQYIQRAYNVEKGIESNLFKSGSYISYPNANNTNWTVFYPDAQQNILAIAYDLPEVKARASSLWNQFNTYQPDWKTIPSLFPNTIMALGPICSGDQNTLATYLNNFNGKFADKLHWGFNVGEVPGIMQVLDYQNGTLPTCLTSTSVIGTVYKDVNNNGIYDQGDTPMSGVTIGIFSYGTYKPLPPTVTDSQGHYTIPFVPSGGVAITENIPTGMTNTQPGKWPNTNIHGVYYVGVNSTMQGVYNFGNH